MGFEHGATLEIEKDRGNLAWTVVDSSEFNLQDGTVIYTFFRDVELRMNVYLESQVST